ncbi:MAG: NTP transferase domain-containing protein [Eggerthellaceae bacterium]|nr:NTP transferase domain-containing protein [Eggerthellaceae bacterium]
MKAIIPAAGMGTRFLPVTKAVPKEMLPVVDKPVLQYIVEEAIAAAADEVVVVSSREKKAIEDHFAPDDALIATLEAKGKDALAAAVKHAGELPVSFVYQDEPLGLGHAVHCAEQVAGERFCVLLGDVIVPGNNILPRMMEISDAHGGANVIAVLPLPDEEIPRYGIVAGTEVEPGVWKVNSIVEKPALEDAPSNLGSFGRYLLSPRVMEILATLPPGAGDEIQLTDALDAVLSEEEMYACVIDPSDGFDTGTVPGWLAANFELAKRAGMV